MHTRVDLFLADKELDENRSLAILNDIRQLLCGMESTANCFDPASELSLLNQQAAGRPIKISDQLYELLSFCIDSHRRTLGYFDIAFASQPYDDDAIRQIQLLPEGYVRYGRKGIRLNLSGVLKGYALEGIRNMLKERGIEHALVNMGNSSVLALGSMAGREGWPLSFNPSEWPQAAQESPLMLCDECLTTSGNSHPARRHILNPHTGQWVEGHRGLAVITADAREGEVLSTALFAAGIDEHSLLMEEYQPRCVYDLV